MPLTDCLVIQFLNTATGLVIIHLHGTAKRIFGRKFTYRKLVWDNELIAQMIAIEKNFWESHVVPRVLPSPDGSDICNEVLNEYFHAARKGSSIRLEGFEDKLRRK